MPLTGFRAIPGGRAIRPASIVFGLLVASVLAAHSLARPLAADEPTRGQILVPADHVDPGATFTVSGYDLDEDAPVRIELVAGDARAELGTATTAPDGTLDVDVPLPSTFPIGYATVLVHALGTTWSTTVLVGDRAEGPGGSASGAPLDWIPLALVLAGTATFALAVWMFARAGRRRARSHDGPADPE